MMSVLSNRTQRLYTLEEALKVLSLNTKPDIKTETSVNTKPDVKLESLDSTPIFTPSISTKSAVKPESDVTSEFNDYFGDVSKLENWQNLCYDLDVEDIDLGSLKKCRKALGKLNVNIVDVVEAQRNRKDSSICGGAKLESEAGKRDGWSDVASNASWEDLESVSTIRPVLKVRKFATRAQLIRYTRKEKKYFPRCEAKEKGPVRCLSKRMK
ncbi:hypothetical protein M7I_7084 [Glarea lozoyensis 74030]|nr:hypothetical protein M7I_7084 [Glarea lozoyensis 74030]